MNISNVCERNFFKTRLGPSVLVTGIVRLAQRHSRGTTAALIAGTILLSGKAQAQTDTWQQTATGAYTWTTPTNWSPAVPNAIGAQANLESALTAAETVNLDSAITLGILNIGALSGTYKFSLAGSTSNYALTLNNGGAGAQINEVSTANGDSISAGIVMADTNTTTALTITNATASQFTLTGGITGSGNLVLNQTGGTGSSGLIVATADGGINNSGTVTFDDSSTGSTSTSSIGVGSNVTEVINNSSVGGTLQINSLVVGNNGPNGGTTLENLATSASNSKLKLTGGVIGTGNLIFDNTNSSGSVFSTSGGSNAINMTGALENFSTGTGGITVGNVIGTNVTSITSNSNSSNAMTFTQNNTFNNAITITAGKIAITDFSTTVFGDLGDNGAGTNTGTFSGGISIASGTTFNWASSATQTIAGGVIGTGTFTVSAPTTGAPVPHLILTGTNSFTGAINVNSGSLTVNGSVGNSGTGGGNVQVNSGGTLGGGGSIAGAVVVNTTTTTATLASGASQSSYAYSNGGNGLVNGTGTGGGLTLSSTLTLNGGSSLTFALGSDVNTNPGYSVANPNTDSTYLTVGGTGAIFTNSATTDNILLTDLTDGTPVGGATLTLRTQGAYLLIAGTAANFSNLYTTGAGNSGNGYVLGVDNGSGGYTAFNLEMVNANGTRVDSSTNYQGLQLYLYNGNLELVPEPGTWALMLGGLAALIVIQRRRRGNN